MPLLRDIRMTGARFPQTQLVWSGPSCYLVCMTRERGQDETTVDFTENLRRPSDNLGGRALVDACRASPKRDLEIEPTRKRLPVRDVDL